MVVATLPEDYCACFCPAKPLFVNADVCGSAMECLGFPIVLLKVVDCEDCVAGWLVAARFVGLAWPPPIVVLYLMAAKPKLLTCGCC